MKPAYLRDYGFVFTAPQKGILASAIAMMWRRNSQRRDYPNKAAHFPTLCRKLKPSLKSGIRATSPSHIHLQRGDECLLRDVDLAELAHALLAFLLLLQKFSFARHVTAVALRGDVLAKRAHGFAG